MYFLSICVFHYTVNLISQILIFVCAPGLRRWRRVVRKVWRSWSWLSPEVFLPLNITLRRDHFTLSGGHMFLTLYCKSAQLAKLFNLSASSTLERIPTSDSQGHPSFLLTPFIMLLDISYNSMSLSVEKKSTFYGRHFEEMRCRHCSQFSDASWGHLLHWFQHFLYLLVI